MWLLWGLGKCGDCSFVKGLMDGLSDVLFLYMEQNIPIYLFGFSHLHQLLVSGPNIEPASDHNKEFRYGNS